MANARPGRTLLIRYRKMGDTLMATPIIRSLEEAGLGPTFTVGEHVWRRIFTSMSGVAGHLDVSNGNPSYWESMRVGLAARKFGCDRALVLRFSNRAALIAKLAGCSVRVGGVKKARPSLWGLTDNVFDSDWDPLPQVEKYYRVAERAVGGSLVRRPTHYVPDPAAPVPIDLAELRGAIAVHLGNGGSNLAWPDDRFCRLIQLLRGDGHRVIATGDGREAAMYSQSRGEVDFDLVGQTSLDPLARVFGAVRLVVALDGGGCRLATAVGTPIVNIAIGSKWNSQIVAPWMSPGEVVEPMRRCDGCVVGRCLGNGLTCVDELKVESVLAACHRLLS